MLLWGRGLPDARVILVALFLLLLSRQTLVLLGVSVEGRRDLVILGHGVTAGAWRMLIHVLRLR